MGYAAMGQFNSTLVGQSRGMFECSVGAAQRFYNLSDPLKDFDALIDAACGSIAQQRALAASIQEAFQEVVVDHVQKVMDGVKPAWGIEGMVITGGCALNVLTNQV